MNEVKIDTEFIKLGQFLKMVSIVTSGSESKLFILNESIMINGEIEKRRGKKLYKDDIIDIPGYGQYIIT